MKIITPNNSLTVEQQLNDNLANSIFLAGPCPRKNYHEEDWREEAFSLLGKLGFDGNVITPTNDRFDELIEKYGSSAIDFQTAWELKAMKKASAIVFWVARHIDKGHPAFTTNIEFGDWLGKPGTYYGFPDDADKVDYMKSRLNILNVPFYNDLETLLKCAVDNLRRDGSVFFTKEWAGRCHPLGWRRNAHENTLGTLLRFHDEK